MRRYGINSCGLWRAITSAIEVASEEGKATKMPKHRFHPETGLLIVSGTAEAMEVVNQVILALSFGHKGSHRSHPNVATPPNQ